LVSEVDHSVSPSTEVTSKLEARRSKSGIGQFPERKKLPVEKEL